MRLATAFISVLGAVLVIAPAREASACGTGFSFFGGGGGGLWLRPVRGPSLVPETIILMGNEALGIPGGIEVDVSPPAPPAPSPIARLLASLQAFGGFIDFDAEELRAALQPDDADG